jgi:hypothetical protein
MRGAGGNRFHPGSIQIREKTMKIKTQTILMALPFALLFVVGCASTPKEGTEMTKEQILEQPDVKKKPALVFQKSMEEVRPAGVRALTMVGCEMKKQQTYYLEGRRPNKMGLFVGSGGETVRIFLYPQTAEETHVWVDTNLSFVGMAGQQNWDDKVKAELKGILETSTAKAQ